MKVSYRADGSAVYQTVDGDLVDQIAFTFYGTHDGTTEILYADNPHLLSQPMILSAGVTVLLRPLPKSSRPPTQIELWTV